MNKGIRERVNARLGWVLHFAKRMLLETLLAQVHDLSHGEADLHDVSLRQVKEADLLLLRCHR